MIKDAFNPESFRATGHELIDMLADYLTQLQQNPSDVLVSKTQSPDEQLNKWQNFVGDQDWGNYFKEYLEDSIHLHHAKYMGHQITVPAPISSLAALMSDLLNNGMGVYEMGQPSVVMEHLVAQRLAKKMGFDAQAGGFLTSGGTLANLTALLAARRKKASQDVWKTGNHQPMALLVSEQAHYCVERAVRIMGWGDAGVIKVPVDENFRLRTDLLETYYQQAKAEGKEVIAAVGSACSTATGAYDDLEALADFCQKHDLWFHVDGAHGASAVFSNKFNAKVKGINRADSVIMDFHKTLLVPALATGVIFKDVNDSYNTFAQNAHYLWSNDEDKEWFNLAKRTFETTKFPMGFKIFTVWNHYGDELLEEMIDTIFGLGEQFGEMVAQHPQFELPMVPECNIVCFRYIDSSEDLNAVNRRIRQAILEEGKFYLVQTLLSGDTYLRVTLANPATTIQDLEELLEYITQIAKAEVSV
ncbi:MAG TPA: pyridoxal-dependent decarboxylase [Microscillaceae bacterium]|nr:pyridoxal-dependent decarboxylase [Microscillaceae bacterium]